MKTTLSWSSSYRNDIKLGNMSDYESDTILPGESTHNGPSIFSQGIKRPSDFWKMLSHGGCQVNMTMKLVKAIQKCCFLVSAGSLTTMYRCFLRDSEN